MLPMAIKTGISAKDFWHMTPKVINAYVDVYKKKCEEKAKKDDYNAWIAGMYVRDAIGNALNGKNFPYPEKPYSENENLSNDQSRDAEFEKEMAILDAMTRRANHALEIQRRKMQQESENGED